MPVGACDDTVMTVFADCNKKNGSLSKEMRDFRNVDPYSEDSVCIGEDDIGSPIRRSRLALLGPWRAAPAWAQKVLELDNATGNEDSIKIIRQTEIVVGTGGAPDELRRSGSIVVPSFEMDPSCDRSVEGHCDGGDAVEFRIARRKCATETWLTVKFNDGQMLVERLPVPDCFRTFRFVCPEGELVWRIALKVECAAKHEEAIPPEILFDADSSLTPDGSSGVEQEAGVQFDPDFGFRIRGQGALHLLCFDGDRHMKASWVDRRDAAVRCGLLSPLPTSYSVENAVEFMAHGLSGREQIEVFVNGFSVQCQQLLRLGLASRPKLLRYFCAPISCCIRSLIIRVSHREGNELDEDSPSESEFVGSPGSQKGFGVMISTMFGVVVGGYNCLPTAEFLEHRGAIDQPNLRDTRGFRATCVQAGQWLWEGDYVMLPYVRVPKPFDPACLHKEIENAPL